MQSFNYVIKDELGIHARPAGLLVKETKKYACSVKLQYGEKQADGKSVLGVMALVAKKGHEITVICDGEDEEVAIEALRAFFNASL